MVSTLNNFQNLAVGVIVPYKEAVLFPFQPAFVCWEATSSRGAIELEFNIVLTQHVARQF